MFSRGEEHHRALNNKSKESVLWTHCLARHQGQLVPFCMRASRYFVEPLSRQVDEAVRIFHSKNLMNRKGEWKKTAVARPQYLRE